MYSVLTRSNAQFGLSDLEDDMSSGLIILMKEKISFPLPLKESHINLTMKTLGSRKRKTSEAMDLNLENIGVEEVRQKFLYFSQAVIVRVTLVSNSYLLLLTTYLFQVSAHVSQYVVDLRIRAEEDEQALKEREKE